MEQLFQTLAILFFVFLNGFFVAAEFAIVKVRDSRIRQLASEGFRRARVARTILENLDAYLSACQVGITLASLALGWIGEPFLARQLHPLFVALGIESPALLHGLAFAIAFGIITYLHIVVGEMAPKSLSIRMAEKTMLWIAYPLHGFYKLFLPFIFLLNKSALFLLKIFGVGEGTEHNLAHSEQELKLVFAHSAKSGHLTSREVEIMENVLALQDKTAKQVMVPRTAVTYLSTTNTFQENLRIIEETQHTRYPLCDGDLDRVLGMVHIKDVLPAMRGGDQGVRMAHIKRDVLFFPENINLNTLFREFQRTKVHMAVLIDEYGGTAGIVALEDILEELVGEIYDEFDEPISFIQQVGRDEYLIDGLCPVALCEDRLRIKLPDYEVETVGGVVFGLVGHIPSPGHRVSFEQGGFVVEAIDRQRIARVRLMLDNKKVHKKSK